MYPHMEKWDKEVDQFDYFLTAFFQFLFTHFLNHPVKRWYPTNSTSGTLARGCDKKGRRDWVWRDLLQREIRRLGPDSTAQLRHFRATRCWMRLHCCLHLHSQYVSVLRFPYFVDKFPKCTLSVFQVCHKMHRMSLSSISTQNYQLISGCWMIDQYGSEELKAKHLPKLASCEELSSYCLTEPDSGLFSYLYFLSRFHFRLWCGKSANNR